MADEVQTPEPTLDSALSEATSSAEAALTQAAQPEQATAPPPTEQGASPPPAQPGEEEWSFDYEFDGRTEKLDRNAVKQLIDFAVENYRRAAAMAQAPEQPPTEKKSEEPLPFRTADDVRRFIEKEVETRTKDATDYVETLRRDLMQREMLSEAEKAIRGDEALSKVAGDEETKRMLMAFVLHAKGVNPNMPWRAVAQRISKLFAGAAAKEKQQFIESKIRQAGVRLEGQGGSPPAPGGKDFGPDDFWNSDKIVRATIDRLITSET